MEESGYIKKDRILNFSDYHDENTLYQAIKDFDIDEEHKSWYFSTMDEYYDNEGDGCVEHNLSDYDFMKYLENEGFVKHIDFIEIDSDFYGARRRYFDEFVRDKKIPYFRITHEKELYDLWYRDTSVYSHKIEFKCSEDGGRIEKITVQLVTKLLSEDLCVKHIEFKFYDDVDYYDVTYHWHNFLKIIDNWIDKWTESYEMILRRKVSVSEPITLEYNPPVLWITKRALIDGHGIEYCKWKGENKNGLR